MICGIEVMILTEQLRTLRDQIRRKEPHSTVRGPIHLERLAMVLDEIAVDLRNNLEDGGSAVPQPRRVA